MKRHRGNLSKHYYLKETNLYNSNYINLLKSQNYGDSKTNSDDEDVKRDKQADHRELLGY